jgi:predicted RNA binding protein YcfA (HicA-like mRNA interferase family)
MFPSLKARQLLAILRRKPLSYRVVRRRGSHRTLRSLAGYPELRFSFHDGATVAPGLVRKILTEGVGLTEREALDLL